MARQIDLIVAYTPVVLYGDALIKTLEVDKYLALANTKGSLKRLMSPSSETKEEIH